MTVLQTEVRKFIEAKIAVTSNSGKLIYPDMYMSAEVQTLQPEIWRNVSSLGSSQVMSGDVVPDARLYVMNDKDPSSELRLIYNEDTYLIAGPLLDLEVRPPDRRHTVFGAGGLLLKIVITALEEKHNICSLHATSFYHEKDNHLLVCVGGPGAGKSILLLEACFRRGFKVLTTEYTHFQPAEEGVIFYKGALFDNVRIGNLIHDFPESTEILKIKIPDTPDIWQTKIVLDFQSIQVETDSLKNPEVTLLFPKIESERTKAHVRAISLNKSLLDFFLNAGEQINRPRLLYGRLPFSSLDTMTRGQRRLKLVKKFFEKVTLREVKTLFAGVRNCWPL